ncbi:hypothetical protein FFWV33_05595 [Flavobacterium faecale]|uniref:histidine kinase n=1 Tax=Flavobacterium faecale TaxID=1355330 RepID=A0A2S1LBA1_9FLAO|nr:ATP-binding protein [Flavobacterium faecale]AWG21043.1 hypothetical protein FFWV33_05595 [Flavobacterium faecale]
MKELKKRLYGYIAIAIMTVSCIVVLGWFFKLTILQTIFPTLVTMKFNTALCFLLLGFSLLVSNSRYFKTSKNVALFLVIAISLATLLQYVFSVNFGIDEFFVKDINNPLEHVALGRMSPQTGILFFNISLVLFFLQFKNRHKLVDFGLFVAIVLTITGFLGFVFRSNKVNFIPTFSQISLITVLLFLMLSIGILDRIKSMRIQLVFTKILNLGLAVLLVSFMLLYLVFSQVREDVEVSREIVEDTVEVIHLLSMLSSAIMRDEVVITNYVLSGETQYLKESDPSLYILDSIKKSKKISKNSLVNSRDLEKYIVEKAQSTAYIINLRKHSSGDAAKSALMSTNTISLSKKILLLIKEIEKEEYRVLRMKKDQNLKQIQHSDSLIEFFKAFIAISLLISYLVVLYSFKAKKTAQILLEKSNERFFSIFNYNPISMAITTVEGGEFVFVNDFYCESTGYDRESLIGKTADQVNIVSTEERAKIRENIAQLGGEAKDIEIKVNKADGGVMFVLFSVQKLLLDGKNCFVYAFVDITERNKIKEKLVEVNHELDSFTYSVSHDLRAPLRAITGYTKILNEDYGDKIDEDGQQYMNVISKNAIKMGQLIDDLLAFSRLGRQNLVLVPVEMNKLVGSLIEDMKLFANGKELEIKYANLLDLKGDGSMLKVIMTNLLSNAVKYSSKKEQIIVEIESHEEGQNIIYSVKDNGVGFDMAYAGKLFAVFQRLHSTTEFEGTGVGLAIVHRIITKHGGKVWAESIPDVGSTFYFSLLK